MELYAELEHLDDVITRLKRRQNFIHNVYIDSPGKLDFIVREAGVNYNEDTFTMNINGQEMPLSEGAIKTAAAMIGQKNHKWFKRFADPQFFPKAFNNYNHKQGFLIRHDGNNIVAVLPDTYQICDIYTLLTEEFLPCLKKDFGEIVAVEHKPEGDFEGDYDTIKIICGKNLVTSIPESRAGLRLMLMISSSDHGLEDTKVCLGLYRPTSGTCGLREQTNSKWAWHHKPEQFATFLSRSKNNINQMSFYAKAFSELFSELAITDLPILDDSSPTCAHMADVLKKLKLISNKVWNNSKFYVQNATDHSQYNLFCCLIAAAKDIESRNQRMAEEFSLLKLFTKKGGIYKAIRKKLNALQ
jgi:hypothetical protein